MNKIIVICILLLAVIIMAACGVNAPEENLLSPGEMTSFILDANEDNVYVSFGDNTLYVVMYQRYDEQAVLSSLMEEDGKAAWRKMADSRENAYCELYKLCDGYDLIFIMSTYNEKPLLMVENGKTTFDIAEFAK